MRSRNNGDRVVPIKKLRLSSIGKYYFVVSSKFTKDGFIARYKDQQMTVIPSITKPFYIKRIDIAEYRYMKFEYYEWVPDRTLFS